MRKRQRKKLGKKKDKQQRQEIGHVVAYEGNINIAPPGFSKPDHRDLLENEDEMFEFIINRRERGRT